MERGRWADRLANGFEVVVEGAVSYRLLNEATGKVIGEYPDSRGLFLETLRQVRTGAPAEALAMHVQTRRGRYVPQGSGASLVDLAEASLGIRHERPKRVAEG